MVVGALLNRVFEVAFTSTIVSDFLCPRDYSRVCVRGEGGGAGIKICPPVCLCGCPSVRYRVCVISSQFSVGLFEALYTFCGYNENVRVEFWR